MPDATTTNLSLVKPEVGGSTDSWGTKLNADLDAVDGLFDTGPVLKLAKGGTGAATAAGARTNLGLGTIATQDAASVAVGALDATGDVGIDGKVTVGGTAEITGQLTASAGVKFGDGTTQTTAPSAVGTTPFADQGVNFTVAANKRYRLTANNVVATLRAAPGDGEWVELFGIVTGCSVGRAGKTIGGVAEDLTLDTNPFYVRLVYSASASGWFAA